METARKIIKEDLEACKRIRDDYKKKREFSEHINDSQNASIYGASEMRMNLKILECRKALSELDGINETELSKTA